MTGGNRYIREDLHPHCPIKPPMYKRGSNKSCVIIPCRRSISIFMWWLSPPSSCAASNFKSFGFLQRLDSKVCSYFQILPEGSMGDATQRNSEVVVLFRGLLAEIIAPALEASLDEPRLACIGMI